MKIYIFYLNHIIDVYKRQVVDLPALIVVHLALGLPHGLPDLVADLYKLVVPEMCIRDRNSAPQTAHRLASRRWNRAVSSSLSSGSTAARNHRHNRE